MVVSTYDPCLLYCSNPSTGYKLVGMQTDDTLILADQTFAAREEQGIQAANIMCKPREQLTLSNPLKFNGSLISFHPAEAGQSEYSTILVNQENGCRLVKPVQDYPADITSSRGKVRKNVSPREQYVSQRALGAYVA